MSPRVFVILLALLGSTVAGCTSGGGAIVCSFDSPAAIATSAWPKFRHDAQNTGTVSTDISANTGQMKWMFPAEGDTAKGPFAASPVLDGDTTNPPNRIYIGSTDGRMYAVDADGMQDPNFYFVSTFPITSTALVAQRFGADALFFGGGDGQLHGVDSAGNNQVTNWPSPIGGFLASSSTLSTIDGTVYTGSLLGFIAGVCPNGVARFALSTVSVQSSPAVGADSTLYIGADDNQLRAIRNDGLVLWSFSASGPILNAPAVAIANGVTTAIYVADRGGFIYMVASNGQPVSGFTFPCKGCAPVGPMQSSPALAGGRLYVGSDDGNLYAVNATTGAIVWAFETGGPVVSSPAVATGGDQPAIVFGSNDGNVYFLLDAGTTPTLKATFPIGAPVRSSPTIDANGIVYVGADNGRLYAIE